MVIRITLGESSTFESLYVMALMHDDVILCVAYTSGRGLVVIIPKKI